MRRSGAEFAVSIVKDVMVPMRDGVRLATDLYFPVQEGDPLSTPLPVILGRTSYDKTWPELWVEPVADFFAPRGYVVALQDLRGRYRSEGTGQYFHTANVHEGEDGYDTIEWIASQRWSNGRVAMTGSSHGGIVQTAALLMRPPHLRAIWIDVAPTNIFTHQSREGGAMSLQMFGALFLHAYDSQEIRNDPVALEEIIKGWENIAELIGSMPLTADQTPLRHVPNLEKVLFHYCRDGEYNDFWSQEICNQEPHFHKAADVPAVYSGGWYDPFAVATTHQFATMAARSKTPQKLIMGPWTHNGMRTGATSAGDVDFGPHASFGTAVYNQQRLRWFDRWLKDIHNGAEHDPPVQIFVMGGGDGKRNAQGRLNHGGAWRQEVSWPLSHAEAHSYYLRADGRLTLEAPVEDEGPLSYTHNPAWPVPTIASNVTALSRLEKLVEGSDWIPPRDRMTPLVINGGGHQKEAPEHMGARTPFPLLADRPDVLVFQTDLLQASVEITGVITVVLVMSSTAVDTDFTAKLLDVYPPSEDYPAGYHLNLSDSIIRARYRHGFDRARMLTPGKITCVSLLLPPTSNLFKSGHRIRLDIASSNFPKYDVNPGTGEPLGRHTRTITCSNTLYMGPRWRSRIEVPVVKPKLG